MGIFFFLRSRVVHWDCDFFVEISTFTGQGLCFIIWEVRVWAQKSSGKAWPDNYRAVLNYAQQLLSVVVLRAASPVSHNLSTDVQFNKRRICTDLISIQCKIFTNSNFCTKKMLLFENIKHICMLFVSWLSLYKWVFCEIVQRCWSNVKLEYLSVFNVLKLLSCVLYPR